MTYSDPDRDHTILDLRTQLLRSQERYDQLYAMWLAGLREARRQGNAGIELALSGDDED